MRECFLTRHVPGLLKLVCLQPHVCVHVCLSTNVSKQTFKMQKINLHVINEAVHVNLGFLKTVSVVVNEGGVSQHSNCIVGA